MDAALTPQRQSRFDRVVDFGTVFLISLAAVATAWCGYQAARWSALQALDYSRANAARIESSNIETRADALRMIDLGLFVQYEAAVFRHDDAFAEFLRKRMPVGLRGALDAWLKTKPLTSPGAAPSPFALPQYHVKYDADFAAASKVADDWVTSAVHANEVSDNYVFITVLFASVTFLGGVAIKMHFPWDLTLTCVGFILVMICLVRMLGLPIR